MQIMRDGEKPDSEMTTLIQDYVVDKLRLGVSRALNPADLKNVRIKIVADDVAEKMIYRLDCLISGKDDPITVSKQLRVQTMPDGKWQALKEYFLPFLKRWFPVRFKSISLTVQTINNYHRLCPHIGVPEADFKHVAFLRTVCVETKELK